MTKRAWLVLIGILGVIILVPVLTFGIRWITADPKGKLQQREEVHSGDYRIAAYNHFFDLCSSVQTAEQNLENSYVELQTAPDDDKERLRTNITGQMADRNSAVNQYNVDARKTSTLANFRASDLPYQLPVTYKKGQRTSCISGSR